MVVVACRSPPATAPAEVELVATHSSAAAAMAHDLTIFLMEIPFLWHRAVILSTRLASASLPALPEGGNTDLCPLEPSAGSPRLDQVSAGEHPYGADSLGRDCTNPLVGQ